MFFILKNYIIFIIKSCYAYFNDYSIFKKNVSEICFLYFIWLAYYLNWEDCCGIVLQILYGNHNMLAYIYRLHLALVVVVFVVFVVIVVVVVVDVAVVVVVVVLVIIIIIIVIVLVIIIIIIIIIIINNFTNKQILPFAFEEQHSAVSAHFTSKQKLLFAIQEYSDP